MTTSVTSALISTGVYLAIGCWVILGCLLSLYIFRRNYEGVKVTSLYVINSVTFLIAEAMIIKLALIVMAPIRETQEASVEIVRSRTRDFFTDFVLFTLVITALLTVLNYLYLKYFAKVGILKHTLSLSITNLSILVLASWLSTEHYYYQMLAEISQHF